MKVNTEEAIRDVTRAIKAGLVVMLHGSPGIGKSSIIHTIANKHNLKLIDVRLSQCDPCDLLGFPSIQDGQAKYIPMDIFPLEGAELPYRLMDNKQKQYDGYLIFFDEFNSAALSVQAASYKIILDKKVGQHNIHPRAAMVCAGNMAGNNAIVNRLSTAMQSRLIHLELVTSLSHWINWANANKLDHRIISYVQSCPDNLHKFDPNHNDKTFACERTWEFASKLIKDSTEPLQNYLALLAGTISEAVAREFVAYTSMYVDLPTIPEILANPKTAKLTEDPSMMYAVSHMIAANATCKNITVFMDYIVRLPVEFETITLQNVISRNKDMIKEACICDWIAVKGMELFT